MTLVPITELIVTPPLPVPELVTVPMLFKLPVLIVIPAALVLLLVRFMFPVPVIPPLIVRTPVPEFSTVLLPLRMSAVLILFAALFPLETKIPSFVPLPPNVSEVPPERVIDTLSSKVTLLATFVVAMVTVPVVPFVPAEKITSSALVIVVLDVEDVPAELVDQKLLVPHVPVAAPEPVVAPLVSQ